MQDANNIDRRVGHLETRMAEVVTALGAFKGTLEEIKQGISNSRPTMWVVLPPLLGFIGMVVAGVVAVTSIRGDISGLYAVKEAREIQLTRMQAEIDRIDARRYDDLVRERDYWRSLSGGNHARPTNVLSVQEGRSGFVPGR